MLNPVAPFRIALRERNLRLLLAGLATSQAGDWLYNLALLAFVYERTHSSMWVGLTTAVRILPEVVLGSLGGVLADRVDRRALMLGSDAVRALTMVTLALVAVTQAPVVLAPLLAALSTAAGSAYPPCVVAILPRLVTDEQLPAANAARVSVTFICVVAGPVFGALLLLLGSPALAFAVNGMTFAVGGLVVGALPRDAFRRPAAAGPDQPAGLLRELQVGWSALRGYRDGVAVVGANVVASAVYGSMTVLLVLFAQRAGAGTAGYGYLLAAAGLGAVLSAGLAQRAASGDRSRRTLSISLVAVGAPLPLVALSGSLPAAAVLVAVIGAGSIVTEVVGDTCLQRALDPAVFARAYGLAIPAYVAAIAVGALLTPALVAEFGLTATFVGVGFAVVGYGAFIAAGGKTRRARVVPRARRAGAAAAVALALALAGASVASADTPAPSTPVHVDAAGHARRPHVALARGGKPAEKRLAVAHGGRVMVGSRLGSGGVRWDAVTPAVLAPEPDRVQIALAHLVDPLEQLVEVVLCRVQVAAGERVVAAGGELADELRGELRRHPGRVVWVRIPGHLGSNEPRGEEEDGDPATELVRQRLAVAGDSGLTRRVGSEVAAREVRGGARCDHDPPAPAPEHPGDHRAAAKMHSEDVDLVHAPPVGGVDLPGRALPEVGAGIGDE